MSRSARVPLLVFALAVQAAAACSSDDGGDGPDAPGAGPTIARIEVRPGSLLLSPERTSAALTAVAYDADGRVVETSFTWVSSDPDQIAVDASGAVQAMGDLGSATVRAEVAAADVRSPPALVAVVQPKPASLLVTDAQVVSVGNYFLPDGATDGEPLMDVRLRGVAPPAPGTVVLGAENAAVAGVTVSATQEGGDVVVRLQSVSIPDLFDRYDLDWQLDLADYDIVMDDAPPEAPKAAGRPLRAESRIEKNFPESKGPLKCQASVAAKLSKNEVDLKLKSEAKWIFRSGKDDPSLGADYLKVAIEGPLTLKGFIGLKMEAGFEARAKCEITGHINVPLLGWFSAMVAPSIPLGVGVAFDGKVTVASLEIGLQGENGFDLGVGFECGPGDLPCRGLGKLDPINRFEPKATLSNGMKDLQVELSASAYFLTGIDLLFLAGVFRFEAVEVTFGPVQSFDLRFVDSQADDRAYASKYDLKIEGKLTPGEGAQRAIKKLLGKDQDSAKLGAELSISDKISSSPTGAMAVDRTRTPTDQKVNFTFNLDPATVTYFLLGYNVESIEIYRKLEDQPFYEHMHSVPATASNQTAFTWEWTPKIEDEGRNEFFAFVKTKLPLIELEIANDSSRVVEVQPFCGGDGARALATASSCQIGGTLSHTMQVDSAATNTHTFTTSEASVSLIHDPEGSVPGLAVFKPMGTWSFRHSGTSSGCTVTFSPETSTGTLNGDPAQGAISVHTDTPPPYAYEGLLGTGSFTVTVTLTCPDSTNTFEQMQAWTLFQVVGPQTYVIDEDTGRLTGSYTETLGSPETGTIVHTWSWDLTLTGGP